MILFWRKNKLIDNFAVILADEVYSQLPPEMLGKQNVKKLSRRFDKEIDRIIIKFRDFRVMNNLGVYGKARFHLTFMERLREHGYDNSFVKEINDHLLVSVP